MRQGIVRIVVMAVMVLAGVGLIAYPFLSNYLYEHGQKEVIRDYDQQVEEEDSDTILKEKEKAAAYNESLVNSVVNVTDPFDPEQMEMETAGDYVDILNLSGDGVMGYIEIPAIDVSLSIYHGTSTEVLEKGVGHLQNSSLPIGGESTHAVLSAHTGLPEKKLFTDLELLEEGEEFYIHVLDEILAYKIDQIKVVTPDNVDDLKIVDGEDYVTLVTCTPYGVNSHRLLVRGARTPYTGEQDTEKDAGKKSQWMRQYILSILAGLAIAAVLLFIYRRIRRHRRKKPRG